MCIIPFLQASEEFLLRNLGTIRKRAAFKRSKTRPKFADGYEELETCVSVWEKKLRENDSDASDLQSSMTKTLPAGDFTPKPPKRNKGKFAPPFARGRNSGDFFKLFQHAATDLEFSDAKTFTQHRSAALRLLDKCKSQQNSNIEFIDNLPEPLSDSEVEVLDEE